MKSAVISRATSGAGTPIVAAVAGKRIFVYGDRFIAAGTVGAKYEYGDGTTQTALSGVMPLTAQVGANVPIGCDAIFVVPAGSALYLNLDANVGVYGHLSYVYK